MRALPLLRVSRAALALAWTLPLAAPPSGSAEPPPYLLFEAGPVRPLALSSDGARLFVANVPDGRLEILDLDANGALSPAGSAPVGLEPVAVAARTDAFGSDEAWVVNHLSDSVSIVGLSPEPHVVRTLLVGDEPRDVVFGGPAGRWAFVTTAHRGQHSPHGGRANRADPSAADQSNASTPGEPRADVWVFDTTALGSELGGTPAAVIPLFGDRPRALAVSPAGDRVYAAVFRSGNRTTPVAEGLVCDTSEGAMANDTVEPACSIHGAAVPGGTPPPHRNQGGEDRPETGLVVQFDRPGGPAGTWSDELGRDWNDVVHFDLPDRDVFEIDATLDPPAAVDASPGCADGAGCWARVGTTLFNLAVNPVSGKVYVSNTDARNHVRFEGPGIHASGPSGKVAGPGEPSTVQGDLARARITVLDGANVDVRHLNKHIDYSLLPAPAGVKERSLATPLEMVVSPDGSTLYLAAFGSGKVGIFDTGELESDTFVPSDSDHVALSGGGPAGLALAGDRLYVYTRFDNAVKVVDTVARSEIQSLPLHSPEPPSVVEGRPFLYDANLTSSNGEASCASCHLFGDMDDLAWDLGDPDGAVVANTNPFNPVVPSAGDPLPREFHPMKGPMTTQSLRGLAHMGPQHWRGDRQGDEVAAFEAFNAAFTALVGRASEIDPADMTKFREFALQLRYPPNPIRKLDNSLRADEAAGDAMFDGPVTDVVANCDGCHTLDPAAGHFGGDGLTVFDGETQHFKIPHLRNAYQKVGMFGMSEPEVPPLAGGLEFTGDFSHQGPQVRGSGYLHDGSVDTLARFFGLTGFDLTTAEEAEMVAFVLAFPSDLAPAVGQQVTLTGANASVADPQASLLIARAEAPFTSAVLGGAARECDLVAHHFDGSRMRGYLYDPDGDLFLPDDGGAGIADAVLRAKASLSDQQVTYTCAPPGAGARVALDRDEDALLNGFETNTGVFSGATDTGTDPARADTDGDGFDDGEEVTVHGTDPTNPASFPGAPPPVPFLGPAGLALLPAALLAIGIRRLGSGGVRGAAGRRLR